MTFPLLTGLRYFWIAAKGYRLRPWKSPYLQWRLETFLGTEARDLDGRKFLRLMWRERARIRSFLAWVKERRNDRRKVHGSTDRP